MATISSITSGGASASAAWGGGIATVTFSGTFNGAVCLVQYSTNGGISWADAFPRNPERLFESTSDSDSIYIPSGLIRVEVVKVGPSAPSLTMLARIPDSLIHIQTLFVEDAFYTSEIDNGNSGANINIDFTLCNFHKFTLTANCTLTFTNPVGPATVILRVLADGTTGRTITWPPSIKWADDTAPTISQYAAGYDLISLYFDEVNYSGGEVLNYT